MRVLLLAALCLTAWPFPRPVDEPVGGIVVDEAGRPLAGVRYWISGFEERTAEGWRVVHRTGLAKMHFTDADGRFALTPEVDLRYDVDFDLSGFVPMFVQEAAPGQHVRVVMQRGHDVGGRVVQRTPAGETGCAGAIVSITRSNPRGLWFETKVVTDERGAFVFPGLLARAGAAGAPPSDRVWQLRCGGASFTLPDSAGAPIDDLRVSIAIERRR